MLFGSSIETILLRIPALLVAITIHEVAHGGVAAYLGDPTPHRAGRLSLNPIKHLDIAGTIMILLFGFGWAKPVQVNPTYFKDPKAGMALVGAAGPLTNIVAGILIGRMLFAQIGFAAGIGTSFLVVFIALNIYLGLFNLIPLPPLDGSRVMGFFLSERGLRRYYELERYGLLILILMFMVFPGVLGIILNVPASLLLQLAGLRF